MPPAEEQGVLDDLDVLLAPDRWSQSRCAVPQAIAEIVDETAQAKFVKACDDPSVPARNIIKAFNKMIGASPAEGTIKRHQSRKSEDRASRCTCP